MRKTLLTGILLGVGALAGTSQAAILMFDFGPTAVTGTDRTVSPYHAITASFTDTTWNTVGTGDVSSGSLLLSDNTTATGVSLNLGIASATSSTLGTQPGSTSALGGGTGDGIYSGTRVARDAIFNSSTGLSMQISGLAAGKYDIFYVGRNTNRGTTDAYTQTLRAGVGTTTGDFNFSTFDSSTITYPNGNDRTTWAVGETYAKLQITLAAGNVLNLAFTGTENTSRAFLNAVQIAPVPEPASLGGIALLMITLGCPRRS